ncbi:MAG TPA: hypothetical protein VHO24_05810 [Opitutaceae bacterium]|nr:hypothetical protein [Opitutaceae bacterium]
MTRFTRSFGFVALLFAVLCAPLMLSRHEGSYADDEVNFHLPAIRQIHANWPALDLNRDALSAISPGYHYVLATVSMITGSGRMPMRLTTWVLSLALLGLLWRSFNPTFRFGAAAVILPLACSNFFIKAASWTTTDNAGLLGVVAVLATSFLTPGTRGRWYAGAASAATTFLRQLHVWTLVPVGWRGLEEIVSHRGPDRRLSRMAALLPVLLPTAVMGLLVWKWHGLVPPKWQTIVSPPGSGPTASYCYLLTIFLVFGIFYYSAIAAKNLREDFRARPALIGGLAGLVIALSGPTTYSMASGRWGGYLWAVAGQLPAIGGRSLFFILLAPLGGALLGAMIMRLAHQAGRDVAALWSVSYLAWAATFLPNRLVFQRYFEPMTLVFLIFWILLMLRAKPDSALQTKRLHLLTAAQLLVTFATAHYQTFIRSAQVAAG